MFNSQHLVRFDDVDGAGIVYYPRFFHFCHKAFEDLFNQKSPQTYPELILRRRLGFPTVHIESDYFHPLYYGDKFNVELSFNQIGNASLKSQYIFSSPKHKKHFEAHITVVCMDLDQKKSQIIPDDLRRFFEGV